jgi:hypothetical protein
MDGRSFLSFLYLLTYVYIFWATLPSPCFWAEPVLPSYSPILLKIKNFFFSFFFLLVQGFELKALHLLGRHSITWATLPSWIKDCNISPEWLILRLFLQFFWVYIYLSICSTFSIVLPPFLPISISVESLRHIQVCFLISPFY